MKNNEEKNKNEVNELIKNNENVEVVAEVENKNDNFKNVNSKPECSRKKRISYIVFMSILTVLAVALSVWGLTYIIQMATTTDLSVLAFILVMPYVFGGMVIAVISSLICFCVSKKFSEKEHKIFLWIFLAIILVNVSGLIVVFIQ